MELSKHIQQLKTDPEYRYTYVIAEIGINHNGDCPTALLLIKAAANAGCDAVKFQKRDLKEIYTDKILEDPNSAEWSFEYLIPILKEVELSDTDYQVCRLYAKSLGLDFIVTPFDKKSVDFCNSLGVDAFKIGSMDMMNVELLSECSQAKKPMIISTGMWEDGDIMECSRIINTVITLQGEYTFDYFLLLANSTYPTPYESINLEYLKRLKDIHPLIGYSGHERGTFIPVAAAALGARVIEKHITLDRKQTGPDHKASMLPNEFKEMVQHLRHLEKASGSKKVVNQAEKLAKEVFAKSAYLKHDLKVGDRLELDHVEYKAPAKGILMHQVKDYIGKPVTCDIKKGELLTKDHFEKAIPVKDWKLPTFKGNWGVKCRFHDFEEYKQLKSPVIEFHMSQKDLDVDFKGISKDSQLVVHAPEVLDRKLVDICHTDNSHVRASVQLLQRAIDKTLEIGKNFSKHKPKFVVHLGGMTLDDVLNPSQEMMERAIDNFKLLKFNKDDIDILPENLPPRPWYLGGQWFQYGFMYAEDMIKFCDYFGLKMTFDVCHAALHCHHDKISLDEYAKKVIDHTSHFHFSDATGIDGEGVQIGEGEMNFDSLFNVIKDKKDDYSWVTEIWSGHVNHGARCRHSMHKLGKYNNIL